MALEEKKVGSIFRDPAREWVEDHILDWDLEDIKPTRGKFTWTNRTLWPRHTAARLDIFLVQNSFMLYGLNGVLKILPHIVSDHKPILLEFTTNQNMGPIPFRFSLSWIQQEGFHDMVLQVWNELVSGSPFFVWEEKLRRLKKALKFWAVAMKSPPRKRLEAQQVLE